ncbi:SHOCT domain-containing protein [Guptibacillus spartinae]|uniref:SHOCT domain-containing protein n=1 Tax=Guptibacillus spartinae TaxID=3025679 RepID=UPI00235E1464|nr:SHOCT domain-containing protein [Pseudalkalibacillus spartinae]
MMSGGMNGGFWGFVFFGILIAIAIIAIIVWMMKPEKKSSDLNSLDTLKERLARGEISEEEYDRLKKKIAKN